MPPQEEAADPLQAQTGKSPQSGQRQDGEPAPAAGRHAQIPAAQTQGRAGRQGKKREHQRAARLGREHPLLPIVPGLIHTKLLRSAVFRAADVAKVPPGEERAEHLHLRAFALVVHVDPALEGDAALFGPVDREIAQACPLDHHEGKIRLPPGEHKGHLAGVAALRRHGLSLGEDGQVAHEQSPIAHTEHQEHEKQQPVHLGGLAGEEAQVKIALRHLQAHGELFVVPQDLLGVEDSVDGAVVDGDLHVVVDEITIIAGLEGRKALKGRRKVYRQGIALHRALPGGIEQGDVEDLLGARVGDGLRQAVGNRNVGGAWGEGQDHAEPAVALFQAVLGSGHVDVRRGRGDRDQEGLDRAVGLHHSVKRDGAGAVLLHGTLRIQRGHGRSDVRIGRSGQQKQQRQRQKQLSHGSHTSFHLLSYIL